MRKIETIWYFVLKSALEDGRYKFTQAEISNSLRLSLSTVNHSLKIPVQVGAIKKESKFFVLQSFRKLLYFWASVRNLEGDIFYKTFRSESVSEIEGMVPAGVIYAGYSAASRMFSEAAADYSKVYFYADPLKVREIEQRFPPNRKGIANVIALKEPAFLKGQKITDSVLTFVDIWNMQDWYASDFINVLEERMHGVLS